MPVIYNKKVEYAYTDPGVKAHTLSWAEYQALSEDDKMNGDLYFIPDKQPEGNPSRIWTKLGTDPLNTTAQNVSGAVNELNTNLIKKKQVTLTTNSSGYVEGSTTDLFGVDNVRVVSVYFHRGDYNVRRLVDVGYYGSTGYNLTFYNDTTRSSKITSSNVTVTFYYIVN